MQVSQQFKLVLRGKTAAIWEIGGPLP